MSRYVYCSNCGTRLSITRKAMPKYGAIIELIDQHECPAEPLELDLKPVEQVIYVSQPKGKFAQKLEEMSPPKPFPINDSELRDRRELKDIASSAPQSIIDHLRNSGD